MKLTMTMPDVTRIEGREQTEYRKDAGSPHDFNARDIIVHGQDGESFRLTAIGEPGGIPVEVKEAAHAAP